MVDYTDLLQNVSYHSSRNLYIPHLQQMICEYFLRCRQIPPPVIENILLLSSPGYKIKHARRYILFGIYILQYNTCNLGSTKSKGLQVSHHCTQALGRTLHCGHKYICTYT